MTYFILELRNDIAVAYLEKKVCRSFFRHIKKPHSLVNPIFQPLKVFFNPKHYILKLMALQNKHSLKKKNKNLYSGPPCNSS